MNSLFAFYERRTTQTKFSPHSIDIVQESFINESQEGKRNSLKYHGTRQRISYNLFVQWNFIYCIYIFFPSYSN